MEHLDIELARGFARGTLSPAAEEHCKLHLQTCQACQELVEREAAWLGLLKLDPPPPRLDGGIERVLASVEPLAGRTSLAGRWRASGPAVALAALLGVAVGMALRLGTAPQPAERLEVSGRAVSPLEREVIAHLGVLQTLANDAWLVEHYEAVRWFQRLIVGDGGN